MRTDSTDMLSLHVPLPCELGFRQTMLSDPATMAYNAPWFPPDGCIEFPETKWDEWYKRWIGHEPERFYAYLRRTGDGAFVGDVCWHRIPDEEACEIGVVIHSPHRGHGYGKQGLFLLTERAFRIGNVPALCNTFESTRTAARRIHRAAGFRETEGRDGLLYLYLTRDEYLNTP